MLVILCGLCLLALLIWLCQRLPWLDKAGVVVLSFTLGILLAASGVLPAGDDIRALQSTLAEVSVALALPLLVFSMDVGAIIVPGFAAAIIGYVLGNYLGIAVAWITRLLTSS